MNLAGAIENAICGGGNQRTSLQAGGIARNAPNTVGTGGATPVGFVTFFACEFTAEVVRADAVPPSGFGSLQIKSAALGLATSESFVPFPIDAKSGGIASQVEIRFTVDRTPGSISKGLRVAAEITIMRRQQTRTRFSVFAFRHDGVTPDAVDAGNGGRKTGR